MTTMTRRLFRAHSQGPLLEMLHAYNTNVNATNSVSVQALFDVDYQAEPSPFELIEAHVELGGEAMAMRNGLMYERFGEQSGPVFAELWQDCTYHIVFRTRMVWDVPSSPLLTWREWHEANPCAT